MRHGMPGTAASFCREVARQHACRPSSSRSIQGPSPSGGVLINCSKLAAANLRYPPRRTSIPKYANRHLAQNGRSNSLTTPLLMNCLTVFATTGSAHSTPALPIHRRYFVAGTRFTLIAFTALHMATPHAARLVSSSAIRRGAIRFHFAKSSSAASAVIVPAATARQSFASD